MIFASLSLALKASGGVRRRITCIQPNQGPIRLSRLESLAAPLMSNVRAKAHESLTQQNQHDGTIPQRKKQYGNDRRVFLKPLPISYIGNALVKMVLAAQGILPSRKSFL